MRLRPLTLALPLVLLALAGPAAAAPEAAPPAGNRLPQGGGILYPAWNVSYWDNPALEGSPRWEQSEIRVRFDWEDWRPIIGSRGEHVRDFPRDGFSARFEARLRARFDEAYTFHLLSDERARLFLRRPGEERWTTLVEAWDPHARRTDTATVRLRPGEVCEVRIDFADLGGDAACELRWSSPSTPLEVIDYLGSTSLHADLHLMFADHFRGWIDNRARRDEVGWPASDFNALLNANRPGYHGRHLLSFRGLGAVSLPGATFLVDGAPVANLLPKGTGYDPATNTTRALFDYDSDRRSGTDGTRFDTGDSPRFLQVTQTQRSPADPVGSGLTEVHVMKPVRQGADRPHAVGEMANGEWREAVLPYVSFRVQGTGLCNDTRTWADRHVPGGPYYQRGAQGWIEEKARHPEGWKGQHQHVYEYWIQAANEMGRDIHFNFPSGTDFEWMEKFALLVKYGSDGREPYAGPVPHPVHPPLNSNLRIILEHGNEMPWSAIQPDIWKSEDLPRHFREKNEIWQLLNFDGSLDSASAATFRYHAFRTARMARAMRAVYGPEGMGEVVRVMIFGQYQQPHQNTFLQYVDDVFNNGAGHFVDDPLPVSAHFWGAGLAVYYGGENYWAESDRQWLRDRSFEDNDLQPGRAVLAPNGRGPWAFEGNAGVVDYSAGHQPAFADLPGGTDSPAMPVDAPALGFQFTTGDLPVHVYKLGRRNLGGSPDAVGELALFRADGQPLGQGRPGLSLGGRGFPLSEDERKPGAWVYRHLTNTGWMTTDSHRPAIYRLEPNTAYVLLATRPAGEAAVPAPIAARPAPGLTIDGCVTATTGRLDSGRRPLESPPTPIPGTAGRAFPHLGFLFSTGLDLPGGLRLAPPDPREGPNLRPLEATTRHNTPRPALGGRRAAFLAGRGRLSQSITVTEPGEYVLVMTGSSQFGHDNPLRVTLGGHVVWDGLTLGQDRKPDNAYHSYGTTYVRLEPGVHEVSIEGLGDDPSAVAYLDAVHIGTMDAYFGGPEARNFMGAGAATGQTDSAFDIATLHASAMAQNWGLVPTCYEGGNSVGGDWNGGGVLFWEQSKWWHPTTKVADINAANRWFAYGGHQFFHYYPPFAWGDYPNAEHYVQWQASRERAGEWKWEPDYGHAVPAVLTPALPHYTGSVASRWDRYWNPDTNPRWAEAPAELARGQWKSWRILVPTAREYTVAATLRGPGTASLRADESVLLADGATGTPLEGRAFLTRGIHTIKVRADSDGISVVQIDVR